MSAIAFQTSDYEQMADAVVNDFIIKKADLNDSILKLAEDQDLNPNQIKRLVEMANNKTFLKMFKDQEVADKNVDFDVADANKIIKKFFEGGDGAPKAVKITRITVSRAPGPSLEADFPDMMAKHRDKEDPVEIEETPDLEDKVAEDTGIFNTGDKYKKILRMRKVAEELMNRVYEAEHDYNENLDKLSADFSKLYGPDYGAFEKETFVRYGNHDKYAAYVRRDLRRCIRWDKPEYSAPDNTLQRKVAALKTAEMQTFEAMCNLKRVQIKYADGIKIANRKLEELVSK